MKRPFSEALGAGIAGAFLCSVGSALGFLIIDKPVDIAQLSVTFLMGIVLFTLVSWKTRWFG